MNSPVDEREISFHLDLDPDARRELRAVVREAIALGRKARVRDKWWGATFGIQAKEDAGSTKSDILIQETR